MKLLNGLFLIALMCLSPQIQSTTTELRSLHRTWLAARTTIWLFDKGLVEDSSFVYAKCNVSETYGFRRYPHACDCIVTRETPTFPTSSITSSASTLDTCDVNIVAPPDKNINQPGNILLRRLGANRVLIQWSEDQITTNKSFAEFTSSHVIILDMSDCSTRHLEFPLTYKHLTEMYGLVVYFDSFDVFLSNETLCGGLEKCRITYDEEGSQINDPVAFESSVSDASIIPVVSGTSSNGFFTVATLGMSTQNKIEVGRVSAEGSEKILLKNILEVENSKHSADYGRLGLCWMSLENRANCIQFDKEDKIRINGSFEIDRNSSILSVHNLQDGSIRFVQVTKGQGDLRNFQNDKFTIFKVHTTGQVERLFEISDHLRDFRCNDQSFDKFAVTHVEGDEEDCFYFACNPEISDLKKEFLSLVMVCSYKSNASDSDIE
ncbi:hypothetical protein QAD02_006168 [Eretmocerus hayati]|uniref:Uncharacterized protein n=1 Tax=Eretmocerus hayati TaxID=131215 RepID=A0ACC2N0J6_9HYME|nr:hypothetical protein QAD02_006168 [Eretmocerus hayati]